MEIFRIKGILNTDECNACVREFERLYGSTSEIVNPIERLEFEDVSDSRNIDTIVEKHQAIALKVNEALCFELGDLQDSIHTIHGYRKGYRGLPHIDNRKPYERVKIVVISLLTSPSAFKGGELDFFGVNEDKSALTIGMGDAIAFPAYMTHKVKLLESGTRHSFVSMFKGQLPFR